MFKNILYIVIVVIGVIGIAATVVAAFSSTSISIGVVLPGIAGAVLIAWGLIHIFRPGPIIKITWLRTVITVIICIGLLSFAVVETLLIAYAGSAHAKEDVNFVIVPGCGIFPDGRLTLTLIYRLDTAYDFLTEHEDAVCIVSGGQGKHEPTTEADAMKRYLVSRGIEASRIIEEGNSFDTRGNMVQSVEIMDRQFPGRQKKAAVVTSAFHVFRAVTLAKNNGIDAYGVPAPTPWYIAINDYMREYIGVLKMVLLDLK